MCGAGRRDTKEGCPALICVAAESRRATACLINPHEVAGGKTSRNRVRSFHSASTRRRQPVGRCVYRKGANDPRGANRPSDSNPASVEESAAADQQHHEDDDEQCGRVHFLFSRVFGERGPASSSATQRSQRTEEIRCPRVRITPTPMYRLTAVQTGVCSLLNTATCSPARGRDTRLSTSSSNHQRGCRINRCSRLRTRWR